MATIQRRERRRTDGSVSVHYRVRYRDPSGRQRSKSFKRRSEAENFAAQLHVELRRGHWVDPAEGKTPFGEWIVEWQRLSPPLRPSTEARNESLIRNHLVPHFGDVPLARITPLQVRNWVASLTAAGLAPATVRECHGLLKRALKGAVEVGLIAYNPCTGVPLPKVEPKPLRILNPPEIAELANAIHPRYRAMILLKAYGGLRLGELAALQRERLDLWSGVVEVVENVVEVAGVLHRGRSQDPCRSSPDRAAAEGGR